jgi:hypothetical protein
MRQLIHIFIIIGFTLLGLNLTLSLPFYYSWDMDLITLTDLLLIKDNSMPAHINHPGLGMYWLLSNVQSFAEYFGLVTELKLSTLFNSSEPMLLIAEHSQLMRIANSLTCIGIAIVLWASLRRYFLKNPVADMLVLLVFLTLPGLWQYDLLMVRTEIYSLFFWSLSLFFILRAAEEDKTTYNSVLAGFFAGLSFFTKIQVFFLLPLLVIFYVLKQEKSVQPRKVFTFRYWWFLGLFLVFSFCSIFALLPEYKADFADRYWVNKFFFVFIAALYLTKRLQKIERFTALTQFLSAFFMGALSVIFLPVVSGLPWESAIRYGFLNFKVLFLRITKFASIGQFDILSNATGLFAANWFYVLLAIALLVFCWFKYGKKYALIFVFGLLSLQFFIGVRVNLQDSLWVEIPFIVASLFLLSYFNKSITLGLISFLLAFNIYKSTGFNKYQMNQQIAYYDGLIYFQGVFVQGQYTQEMNRRYPNIESRTNALQLGSRVSEIKNILFLNFPDTNLNLRDVSGNQNFWAIRLNRHEGNSLNLLYRPDQTQKIYWPVGFDISTVSSENCEKISVPELEMNSKKYVGFALKGKVGKGQEAPVFCKLVSANFQTAFISVEHIPQATFVGY